MPEYLTVVCGATKGVWTRRAGRALDSVREHAPDVQTILYEYKRNKAAGDADRLQGILEAQTPWVLSIDADVLATGDVRRMLEHVTRFSDCQICARQSNLHSHPYWHQSRYETMLARADVKKSMYRDVVWNGAFLIHRRLVERVVPRLMHWTSWYLAYQPVIFQWKHKKPGQVAVTLALAEAGVGNDGTFWADAAWFGWHSHPREIGLIHHFSGKTYIQLERQGKLEASIQERRDATTATTTSTAENAETAARGATAEKNQ